MTFDEIKCIVLEWDSSLSPRMKKYIHYRTMRNFILHFDEIKSEREREKILTILEEYVEAVKANDYSFERVESAELASCVMFPIRDYYKTDCSFMSVIKLQEVFIYGIMADSVLFFTGLLAKLHYVPIATCVLLAYHIFLRIFKIPQGRVYGMFY
jgi:hypothetical protein